MINYPSNGTRIYQELGEGKIMTDITLEPGEHLIKLTVTDTHNAYSIAYINLSVLSVTKPNENVSKEKESETGRSIFSIGVISIIIIIIILITILIILLFFLIRKKPPKQKTMDELTKINDRPTWTSPKPSNSKIKT